MMDGQKILFKLKKSHQPTNLHLQSSIIRPSVQQEIRNLIYTKTRSNHISLDVTADDIYAYDRWLSERSYRIEFCYKIEF